MWLIDNIRWKLNGLYYKKLYKPKINFTGKENFEKSIVTYSKANGVTITDAKEYNQANNSGVSLVCLANETYVPLLKSLIQSLAFHQPLYDVTLIDIGIADESLAELKAIPNVYVIDYKQQFKERADKAQHLIAEIFKLKQETIINIKNYGKHRVKVYADSACVFLGSLTVLKNFVGRHGFYAGMTQTPTWEWGWHIPEIVKYWQANFPDILNPDYFGIEAGFMAFDMENPFAQVVTEKLNYLLHNHLYLATSIFPFDQVMAGIAINELQQQYPTFEVNLHPNSRAAAIQDKKVTFEKNTLWRAGNGHAPLFGYAYHNNSSNPTVPKRRFREIELDYKTLPAAL